MLTFRQVNQAARTHEIVLLKTRYKADGSESTIEGVLCAWQRSSVIAVLFTPLSDPRTIVYLFYDLAKHDSDSVFTGFTLDENIEYTIFPRGGQDDDV